MTTNDDEHVSVRYRVNVSRTQKGHSFECTVDAQGLTVDEVLQESDELVAKLHERYGKPPEGETL